MDVPISLGVILATAMSLFQTMRGSEQVYFDAAVTLLFFYSSAACSTSRCAQRASAPPQICWAATDNCGGLRRRPHRADPVRTSSPACASRAAGERIAADGIVRSGTSEIDESLITGESAPRRVAPGDTVFAGTVNLGATANIEVTARDDNSLLAEIARLMAAAEQGRGLYVRLADRAARLYAPAVHILGPSTFIGWMLPGMAGKSADGGHRRLHHHLPLCAGAGRAGGPGRGGKPAVLQGIILKAPTASSAWPKSTRSFSTRPER